MVSIHREILDEPEPPILRIKTEIAIKRVRYQKAAGSDDIVAKMIKTTSTNRLDMIHKICFKIWTTGK